MNSKAVASACFAALVGSTLGFAPQIQNARSTTALAAKSKSMPFLDAQPKLDGTMAGDVGFDPLGFSNTEFDFSKFVVPSPYPEERTGLDSLYWMREAELKHGRTCQLAVLGWIAVDLGFRFPGEKYAAIATSLAAHDAAVANGDLGFFLSAVMFPSEIFLGLALYEAAKGSGRQPGDFSFDPLNLKANPERKKNMEEKEIAHCRLAMLAFSGLVTQAALGYDKFPYF
mmetsp:Transcript_7628/g.11601  ORF Transcript_7628/g.11601 Transcript_7628/m.11601 type:complete len:228 (-) Transcript_7628:173-856(-)|eukprot:CAMPEP_0113935728 /NCGR_PEP_ID=MMETSP1339-20121228/2809_1 /TAXON_ID=94617 /ORGANISM="Fibrocapsa japonica" /LENGTH=227 /DNA_ID=CAMNT_0000937977 /DNA_START=201 /DNA_END=884 /DNA_ORIENTATION=- /assembly_acc=CAM_ASM_000762